MSLSISFSGFDMIQEYDYFLLKIYNNNGILPDLLRRNDAI